MPEPMPHFLMESECSVVLPIANNGQQVVLFGPSVETVKKLEKYLASGQVFSFYRRDNFYSGGPCLSYRVSSLSFPNVATAVVVLTVGP